MNNTTKHYNIMKNIVDKETQKSLEIVHLREIIMDLIDAVDKQISHSNISRHEIFCALQDARNSIQ
jgi:hypothetical protein